jgi:hypothetical protein
MRRGAQLAFSDLLDVATVTNSADRDGQIAWVT